MLHKEYKFENAKNYTWYYEQSDRDEADAMRKTRAWAEKESARIMVGLGDSISASKSREQTDKQSGR